MFHLNIACHILIFQSIKPDPKRCLYGCEPKVGISYPKTASLHATFHGITPSPGPLGLYPNGIISILSYSFNNNF